MTTREVIHEVCTSFWAVNLMFVLFLSWGAFLFSPTWYKKTFHPNWLKKIFGLYLLSNATAAGIQAIVISIMIVVKKFI